ncbi:MAG: hypothetical protein B7Z66_03450 [Chromatiales bacterium 21-64-14]|nr:MAG: hypothetical protein B7Z66_03450 [Chromatiales bacterium 21-64-14]
MRAPLDVPGASGSFATGVLCYAGADQRALHDLLARYRLCLHAAPDTGPIPGSYWGAPEAGLIGATLYAGADTPVHSVLHEACHYVCMAPERRAGVHTDAGGDYLEEGAVCYLQILLADYLPDLGRVRLMADMDTWGYSFRLGSARAWFTEDAEDAGAWLERHGLMRDGIPTWRLRS